MGLKVWRKVPGRILLLGLDIFTFMALIYEGYNQGLSLMLEGFSCILITTTRCHGDRQWDPRVHRDGSDRDWE